jgi:hypothetical protein
MELHKKQKEGILIVVSVILIITGITYYQSKKSEKNPIASKG